MSRAPILHQETRLPSLPASPSHVLHISTTTPQQSSTSFGAGRKRAFDEISGPGLDEDDYSRKYLATEGSVFFRRKERCPRSFLWRVLEDRKVLEVQCVDLVHSVQGEESESWLTFRLGLPAAIIRDGVALADSEDTDALEVFVLTTGNELFTFTLKRDLLSRETVPNEFDPTTCFRKYVSGSFAFRQPYRLVATSSFELLVSLHDGGLMHLQRQPSESGSQWRETFFSEGSWSGTLKGLIGLKRQQSVRYGEVDLLPNAIAAMAKSPDGKYFWTVSLDHELRAWSAVTGKATTHMDLLYDEQDRDSRSQKHLMRAEQKGLLQVVTVPTEAGEGAVARVNEDGKYCIVLFSPKDHQFKFYEVSPTFTSVEGEGIRFDDLQPALRLTPPVDELMNTNIWQLEDFCVAPEAGWRNTQLWIRVRSGALCKIFTLSFDLLVENSEASSLSSVWQSAWTTVDSGMQTAEALRSYADFPGELGSAKETATTPTEKWLNFIFYPNRFSTVSIESALHIYRKGRGLPPNSSRALNAPVTPLQDRLTHAIASKIILRRLDNGQPDFERYQSDINAQWTTFYALLSHLHTRRHESIGFAFDAANALPWSICADFVSPIRASSHFDTLCLNQDLLRDDVIQQIDASVTAQVFPNEQAFFYGQLMAAARHFRFSLSASFREKFEADVVQEALGHDFGNAERNEQRLQALYESHNFHEEVMDDEFNALVESTAALGGLDGLGEETFLGLLECIDKDASGRGKSSSVSLNHFGDKLTVAVAKETVERNSGLLLDILTLIVFMYGDLDQEDLSDDFVQQIGPLYDAIIVRIKHHEMLSWLAKNTIRERHATPESSKPQKEETELTAVSLLERIFIGDWDPRSFGEESMPMLLTMWSKQWTYGLDLFRAWDGVTGHVFAFLIREKCYELATDFQKFLSKGEESSAWLQYLEGRLLIATGDFALSGIKFRAAAEAMAEVGKFDGLDTAELLSPEEKSYFGKTQSMYYQHIADLFDKLKVFSYTAEFARVALERFDGSHDNLDSSMAEFDRRKGLPDVSPMDRLNDFNGEIGVLKLHAQREEIVERLFNALKQTGRFLEAFQALNELRDPDLQKANLRELISSCVKQDAVPTLLQIPFREADMVHDADEALLQFARRSLTSGTSSVPPYYQTLYAFRTQHGDFRGAAEVLYENLERMRWRESKNGMQDPEDDTLEQAYVLLINTLACCGEDDAWLLADPIAEIHGHEKRRRLVTLADLRREYSAELDRRSEIMQGRFPLLGSGDEMDVL